MIDWKPHLVEPLLRCVQIQPTLHNHSNMVVHVLADISQEACCNDTDRTESNTHVVHVLVRLSVSDLSCTHNQLVRSRHAGNARDLVQILQERGASQLNGLTDELWRGDVQLCRHGPANVVRRGGHKFRDENVVAVARSVDGCCETWRGGDLLHAVPD